MFAHLQSTLHDNDLGYVSAFALLHKEDRVPTLGVLEHRKQAN